MTKTTLHPITKQLRRSFCTNHNDKMEGMQSISTSPLTNRHCVERMQSGNLVCAHCFSKKANDRFPALAEKLKRNSALWGDTLYSTEYMPKITVEKFRLEAFGDLFSVTQARNYLTLCRANPSVHFALWTKNPFILWDALEADGFDKPKNLVVVYSSPVLNHPADNMLKLYIMPNGRPMIDKVFTVYTPDYIKANTVKINCGARNCKACGRCYTKRTGAFVNEKLK